MKSRISDIRSGLPGNWRRISIMGAALVAAVVERSNASGTNIPAMPKNSTQTNMCGSKNNPPHSLWRFTILRIIKQMAAVDLSIH